jgi:hypothetical protein
MRTLAVRGGAVEQNEPMPPELGAVPLVDGAHKLAAYFAAQVDFIPRLEEDLGWLLFAACGSVSTVTDSPEAGLQTHYFLMDTSDYLALKWLTIRQEIPSEAGANNMGIQGTDCRIANMLLNFTAASRLTTRMSVLGRTPSFSDDPTSWTYNAAETSTSVAIISADGSHFRIPSFQAGDLPLASARVTLDNTVSQPQQEFIIGSYHPDDVIGLYRGMTIEGVYQWEDEDLYLALSANGQTGAAVPWTADIYESSVSVKAVSPSNISGYSNPYSLTLTAPRVIWYASAPPESAGVNIVQLPITGIVGKPTSGDPFLFALVNEVASYTWPT